MNKKIFGIIITIAISIQLQAFEKVGVTSFQYLKVSPDPRAMAMGGAFTALEQDAVGFFGNPGVLAETKGISVFFSQTDYLLDTQHFATAVSYSNGFWSIGVGALSADYGSIEETTIEALGFDDNNVYNPGLTGNVLDMGAYSLGISFSQKLTNKFSYGLVAKSVQENFQVLKKSTIAWDLGLVYNTYFKSIRLGATLRNFGSQVKFVEQDYPLPQTMTIGLAVDLIGNKTPLLVQSASHRLLFSVDLIQPRDYDQQYDIGLEYSLINMLFIRGGYRLNYDTEGFAMGAGVAWSKFKLDYSYSSYGSLLGNVHRISLSF